MASSHVFPLWQHCTTHLWHICDVVVAGGIGVLDVDDDHLPVGLIGVDHGQHTQHLVTHTSAGDTHTGELVCGGVGWDGQVLGRYWCCK